MTDLKKDFSARELFLWLENRIPLHIRQKLRDNKVSGQIFLTLTRADLSDPKLELDDFLDRKLLWDFLDELRKPATEQLDVQIEESEEFDFSYWVKLQKAKCKAIQEFDSDETIDRDTDETYDSDYETSMRMEKALSRAEGAVVKEKQVARDEGAVVKEKQVARDEEESSLEDDDDCLSFSPCRSDDDLSTRPGSSSSTSSPGSSSSTSSPSSSSSTSSPGSSSSTPSSPGSYSSTPSTPGQHKEGVKTFRFYVPNVMEEYNKEGVFPKQDDLRRFIRNAATCFQAAVGDSYEKGDVIVAAQMVCERLPVLKDPKPPSYNSNSGKKFPYWATVQALMQKNLSNAKAYVKTKQKRNNAKLAVSMRKSDYENMEAEIMKEVKRKPKNTKAIKEMQCLTYTQRWDYINKLEGDVIDDIKVTFPYFMEHESILLNELELHMADVSEAAKTIEMCKVNWTKIYQGILNAMEDEFPHISDLEADDTCGAFMANAHKMLEQKTPLLNYFPEGNVNDVTTYIKQKAGTSQPMLFVVEDDNTVQNTYLVIDKKVFLEMESNSYVTAMVTLMGAYLSFNCTYEKSQKLIFQFLEEYVLGLQQSKKSVKYRMFVGKMNIRA